MTNLAQLHAYIESHGFRSWTFNTVIEISVPATRRLPNGSIETVELIERCAPTLSAVRKALGY